MKFLVIFVAIIVCANAYRIRGPFDSSKSSASSEELLITPGGPPQWVQSISDSISSASSEELLLLPPGGPKRAHLPGVGVVPQPILQAVKVKGPRYGNVLNTNRILAQLFGPQEAVV